MKVHNYESYHIRKWYTQVEDTLANETGELADGETLNLRFAAALPLGHSLVIIFSSLFVQLF